MSASAGVCARSCGRSSPSWFAFIIRTAGLEQDEAALRQDSALLQKSWQTIQKRAARVHAPASVYDEQEILTRVVRDNFSDDLDEILIDSKPAMREMIKTCQEMIPSLCTRIHYYDSAVSIFDTFEVEKQFQKALKTQSLAAQRRRHRHRRDRGADRH